MSTLKKNVGRPCKDDSKNKRITIRLTDEEYEKLQYICYKNGKTVTGMFTELLDMGHSIAQFSD